MLKIVEIDDNSLVDEIVWSTNRQTKVENDQFLATLDCIKSIEKYFDARGKEDTQSLYFERRTNQFTKQQDIPAIRVFDIKQIARCAGAMFLDKPDLASRYPTRLTGELRDIVFKKENKEDIYYTAANALYRLNLHFSNNRIDTKYGKLKWHILMAVRYFLSAEQYKLSSTKIQGECETIDAFMNGEESAGKLRKLCEALSSTADVTRDRLKGQPFVQEIRQNAINARKAAEAEKN
jgi:hypothetical protein